MFGLFKNSSTTQIFSTTHTGDRKENQDSFIHFSLGTAQCYLVADGMGGHSGGRLASQRFCAAIENNFARYASHCKIDQVEAINTLIDDARQEMCVSITREDSDLSPHTTAVLAIYDGKQLHVAHIGDSRAYLIQDQTLKWISRDHSVAQLMVDQGEIDSSDVSQDESQNILYRSVECQKLHKPSISSFDIKSNDSLILCTDGFWCFVEEPEFLSLAQTKKPKKAIKELTHKVYQRAQGKSDNITALLVQFPVLPN